MNRLLEAPSRSPWLLFFGQFKSLLILVLIIGAGLAASISNIKDAAVILCVVILNASLGFYQESGAPLFFAKAKMGSIRF